MVIALLWLLMAGSIALTFHALRHRDPPGVIPPEERPIDFTTRRRT
jgi:hypothetical protein